MIIIWGFFYFFFIVDRLSSDDTGALWLPFQTAAGTVTTLYKGKVIIYMINFVLFLLTEILFDVCVLRKYSKDMTSAKYLSFKKQQQIHTLMMMIFFILGRQKINLLNHSLPYWNMVPFNIIVPTFAKMLTSFFSYNIFSFFVF